MTDKQIIIEDCPHFIGGCCQEYLDGVCENHKCDLKIIRELKQQLDQLKAERDSYIDKYFLESQKVLSLRKVLKDIKDTVTYCMKQDICTTCNHSDKCYIEDEEIPSYDVCKLILQKISEVEDG